MDELFEIEQHRPLVVVIRRGDLDTHRFLHRLINRLLRHQPAICIIRRRLQHLERPTRHREILHVALTDTICLNERLIHIDDVVARFKIQQLVAHDPHSFITRRRLNSDHVERMHQLSIALRDLQKSLLIHR